MVGRMMTDFGITINELNDCLCSIPLFEDNITALKLAQSAGAMNFILSDANHHYITVILEHHNIVSSFVEIETNFSHIDGDDDDAATASVDGAQVPPQQQQLRIFPHQPSGNPHSCALCPQNLCKGNVLDKWRDQYSFDKIVYVGDGAGDFCPVVRMDTSDVALCRQDCALLKKCLAAQQEAGAGVGACALSSDHRVRARVMQWSSGRDVLTYFQEIFHDSTDDNREIS
jgi:pyridoxal phosphate phosphatase PHOSPHO2